MRVKFNEPTNQDDRNEYKLFTQMYKRKYLNGIMKSSEIVDESGIPYHQVSKFINKWVQEVKDEFKDNKNKIITYLSEADRINFNEILSNATSTQPIISDCKGLSKEEIQKIVNKL